MKKEILLWLLVLVQSFLSAQDTLKINLLAQSFLKQSKLPGLSIAVSKNGELIYAKGFGYANREDNILMAPSTRIRTASVAKVITATALGRLATEGLLDFDKRIKHYVPYINEKYANLTVRQLAGHTSGLRHRPSGKGYQKIHFKTIRETLEIIDGSLLFKPGTEYRYSTAAFNLLAAVIEGASGMSYEEYMQQHIFEPLGMVQTQAEDIRNLTQDDAAIYFFRNDKLKRDRLNNGSYKIPGAAYRSTPSDLVRLMKAYSQNGFISKDVVKEMFKSNRLADGQKTNVGIAWRSSLDVFGNTVIEHAGNWRGARTVLVYFPEEEMSIALMINAECQILIEETAHIFAALFRENLKNYGEDSMDRVISAIHNTKNGPISYKGTIKLKNGKGMLGLNSNNYLKSSEIIQISNNGFALSTFYGLFYLEMCGNPKANGKVYAYYNRNERNPKEEQPLLEFSITTAN